MHFLYDAPKKVLAYERVYSKNKAWIFLNFSHMVQEINAPEVEIRRGFSNKRKEFQFQNTVTLFPDEVLILFSLSK
jgi:hypothetical protein